MADHMTDPSNNFQTGGALIDPQRLGCTGFIGLGFLSLFAGIGFAAFVVMIADKIWGQG